MSSRARTTQPEEVSLLIQEKRSAPDTLLKLYVAIEADLKARQAQLTPQTASPRSARRVATPQCR